MGLSWPSTLPRPMLDGYSTSPGVEIARTEMESGEARTRRRTVSAPDTIKLSWLLDASQMAIFRAYWDAEMAAGSAWCDMPVDVGDGVEQKSVRAIGQYTAARISGSYWRVGCEVEVRKLRSTVFDYLNLMGLPSLDLDFAGTQSLNPVVTSSRQVAPSVSFSRASTATYFGADGLLKTAAENEPRFDFDPITLTCKGLLIEEARTNYFLQSSDVDTNNGWTRGSNLTRVGKTTAPDGSMSATVYSTASTLNAYVSQTVALQAGKTYTVSVWARLVSGSAPSSGALIACDYDADGSGTVTAGERSTLGWTGLDGTWRRFSLTFVNVGAVSAGQFFCTDFGNGAQVAIWGAQIEIGNFVTSFIPTLASSASRILDLCTIGGGNFSSWYRAAEGSFVLERISARYLTAAAYDPIIVSDGTSSNAINMRVVGGASQICDGTMLAGGVPYVDSPGATMTDGVKHKQAIAFSASGYLDCMDGGSVYTDNALTIPVVNQMRIGASGAGHFCRLRYFPRRLSGAELQAITS